MREIKFRAWDKEDSVMDYSMSFAGNISENMNDKPGIGEGERFSELMQYTGLSDKNGKEIYEGDIVVVINSGYQHWQGQKFSVYYCEDTAKFKISNNKSYPHDIDEQMAYMYFEVVGNIYEKI